MTLPILRVLIIGADKKPGANLYIRIKTNVSTTTKSKNFGRFAILPGMDIFF